MALSAGVSGLAVRRWAATAFVTVVASAGAAVLGWALPRAWDFTAHGPPSGFWMVSLLALVSEAPLFALAGARVGQARVTLSVCFTFGILLLWGAGPAIVVQALAAVVRSVSLRLPVRQSAFLFGRLVCGLGAVEAVRAAAGSGQPSEDAAASFLLVLAVTLFAVAFGLLVLGHVVVGVSDVRGVTASIREDMLGTGALLLLVFPVLLGFADRGLWIVLILVPLLAWNQLARASAGRQETLRREPVSGALNQRGLAASFEELTAANALDLRGGRPFGVVLANLGTAEAVRRDLGRAAYDALVASAAARLVEAYGADRVGRFAGGFVVLLPDLSPENAAGDAARIVRILTPSIEVGGIPFSLDPVAGVALSTARERDLDALVAQADLAVSWARGSYRPVQVYVPETASGTRRRRDLLAALYATLRGPRRHDELAVLYQPQVELATNRLVGVEALIRWTHPQWGPVPTDELIAAIEPSDVMRLLTVHIVDRVTGQLAAWNRSGFQIRAAVNVSVTDLHDDRFPDRVGETLHARRLPPSQLTIEITEGVLVTNEKRVIAAAGAITAMGIGLSLDDFGTGYASLQQLRQLPLTEVKVDQSYVRGMTAGPAEQGIIAGVHQFAKALGLGMVAEGVEDAATAAALAELPGTVGQGYYFGKPMPPGELTAWRGEALGPATCT
ncbi:MAG TPA: GGDEF domain-containing phosphodiesterase [Jiangellales bacterium]|nr:GGDEF domain-containing phosphodiesterase [Jiangellales bacterium]